ncbi:DUF1328 domain-containing protein [Stakelama saccharophila]|uniref:UPF0391 membrane protein RPR59_03040 n=1 Tax=Stakelama saccharophila TaxID=3075605 RepID=A0ABZ0BA46_9SPHN|nr:DUF1328 family protein [Stakelama sp. W311]WNO54254.1 DUF1328 family protein [Stakelama sp. W311]
MIKWALIFLVLGLVLAAIGFGGAAGVAFTIAKVLAFIAIALFVIFLVMGIMAGKAVKDAVD